MIKLKTLIFEALSQMDAEQIFSRYGVPNASSLPKSDLKQAWVELSKAFHPDRNPSRKEEMTLAMQWINSAYDVLKKSPQHFGHRTGNDDVRWAQAGWAGGVPNRADIYNKSFQDLNYCKKKAWEVSGKPPFDREHEYRFIIWDGSYFRGGFSVYAIPEKLFEISQMVVKWETFHRAVAVFYQRKIDATTFLINLRGQEVNPPKEFYDFDTNDQQFRDYLRRIL